MQQWHILFPVDFSAATRTAAGVVSRIATMLHGAVTALTVVVGTPPAGGENGAGTREGRERVRAWLMPDLSSVPLTTRVRYGLPGVEISRLAEESAADLVVLVEKRRSQLARITIGDTVDAVIRRSTVPSLILQATPWEPHGIVVALDGSERGLRVFAVAERVAEAAGWPVEILSVEPPRRGEPEDLAAAVPSVRGDTLSEGLARLEGSAARVSHPIMVRRGDVVDELLGEMAGRGGWCLAIGYRRGGPPGILEAGSVARQVVHRATCPVLTVPL